MLVVLSDFHLADGSAGDHNLRPEAYVELLDRVTEAHARVRQYNPQSRVELLFAGDIFELRRTHFWFGKGDDRPWRHFQPVEGAENARPPTSEKYLEMAVELFTQIMIHPHVSPIKQILGDQLAQRFGGIEPLRSYLPGEADRLINMHPGLRARVIDFLGLDLGRATPWNPEYRFPNTYLDELHGVFVRHGHEHDLYAFEGDPDKADSYDNVPMNDLITTELFARLTFEASRLQPKDEVTTEVIAHFRQELERIDNVRPPSAVIHWLTRHFKEDLDQQLLRTCLGQALTNFQGQPYVKWWFSSAGHDKWYNPLDEADRLQLLLEGLEHLTLGRVLSALKLYDRFAAYNPFDRYAENAGKEEAVKGDEPRVCFVVNGHTHHPESVPLRMVGAGATEREVTYVNVGSFRPTPTVTRDGRHFVTNDALGYAIFYRMDERPGATGPTCELWTGQRSRVR
jgi:UDP-2,3-diacylglucosamine pyrophosphatase LpxH